MTGVRTARSIQILALWRKLIGQASQLTRISNRNPWQNLSPDDWVKVFTASAVFDMDHTDTKDLSDGTNMVARLLR